MKMAEVNQAIKGHCFIGRPFSRIHASNCSTLMPKYGVGPFAFFGFHMTVEGLIRMVPKTPPSSSIISSTKATETNRFRLRSDIQFSSMSNWPLHSAGAVAENSGGLAYSA